MSLSENMHKLRAFYALARTGSFSRAAEFLGISQPAVSLQVKALEEHYAIPLLSRQGRHIALTEAGRLIYGYLERILALGEDMERAIEALKGLRAGSLLLGASTTVGEYVLPAIVGHFHRLYPDIEIKLEIANTSAIAKRVSSHQLDLGFVGDVPDDPELQIEALAEDQIVLIASPENPLSTRGRLGQEDLKGQKLIMREEGSATRRHALRALARLGLELPIAMELGSNEAVKQAVAANLGIGALSAFAVGPQLRSGALVQLELAGWECTRYLNIIYPAAKLLSPAEQAFLNLIRSFQPQDTTQAHRQLPQGE
jgi:DNA-binding transcriptional LysR family regulator